MFRTHKNDSPALQKVRADSRHLSKLLLSEFSWFIVLYLSFAFGGAYVVEFAVGLPENVVYIGLIFGFPLAFNTYRYFYWKGKSETVKSSNCVIVQLILFYVYSKFLF